MFNIDSLAVLPFDMFHPLCQKIDKTILKFIRMAYEKQKIEEPPKTLFIQPDTNICYLNLVSPHHEATPEAYYSTYVKGYSNVSFSTYPVLNGEKFGKPIADCTTANIYKDCAVFCIADGCGMGKRPATSAHVACEKFTEYVSVEIPKTKTLAKAQKIIVEAIAYVQTAILQTQELSTDAGLTTFLGIVVLRTGTSFACMYCNIGDCRALVIDPRTAVVNELIDDYSGRVDVKTTGGRLGPVEGDYPELDNFKCGIKFCSAGSVIALMTDGVCDNFDIKTYYQTPKECGLSGLEWSDDNEEHWEKRKEVFYSSFLSLFFNDSLEELCFNLYNFIIQKTKRARECKVKKIETFVGGKMDHSTFACFRLDDTLFTEKIVMKKKMKIPDDLKV
ncbi:hypothetical protein EHI8A_016910 [Entamoeba histolytica HM-1:IMSS-B]|uniref:PPM-type phosphatase domain-containing protein n=6 Tax=Entamoeba histolytica TaxID=5759 RepID=C4M8U9_ENTH1|nr:hypothetical protein EHI_169680 [Entamoeba histolytica HM-1:IMSS]EMD44151.1 phosphatase, putative [Entamoeba histolytica KU27]EMH76473.1 hypothetical protein EHI8A_016910 [Entamoeba histolytica HM-1:IMSS-B]EMS13601.1 protein phosphatase 2c-related protein [Entamoeba histolytica HM-3:IMSS]ENY59787.1 protein phosphatase 2c-related protein, putative [Entamoeba histolytica HM-1:IMSS-A]GAT98052.1 hypothetical protein CL6EHI_169680 [Entamoeba histolytica]|eukprot:XP_650384.1 hypothetical protein EHI_169680 [Entamoeba histolytica HM-1:IMSS]